MRLLFVLTNRNPVDVGTPANPTLSIACIAIELDSAKAWDGERPCARALGAASRASSLTSNRVVRFARGTTRRADSDGVRSPVTTFTIVGGCHRQETLRHSSKSTIPRWSRIPCTSSTLFRWPRDRWGQQTSPTPNHSDWVEANAGFDQT
jgi:hypothetical protein